VSFGNVHEGLGYVHPGVIQQDIEAFEAGERVIHLRAVGYIANDGARAASRFGDAFGDLIELAARAAE
jgi:hypothetical protein